MNEKKIILERTKMPARPRPAGAVRGGEEAVEKVKPVAIQANVKVNGLDEAMDEMKELGALLEKARSLVSDLAKEVNDMSVEIKI